MTCVAAINYQGIQWKLRHLQSPFSEANERAKSDRFGGHFAGWSDEDVIRAYLLQQLRRSDPGITAVSDPAAKYMQPMKPMFLSSRELAGYWWWNENHFSPVILETQKWPEYNYCHKLYQDIPNKLLKICFELILFRSECSAILARLWECEYY